MDSDFNLDKLFEKALKERKWKPLNNIKDITGWNIQ